MSAESNQGPEFRGPGFHSSQSQSPESQSLEFQSSEFQSSEFQTSEFRSSETDPRQDSIPMSAQQPEPDRGRSRQPDPVSIGSGLVFFLIGGAYLLASGGHLTVNAGWTLSLLALGLGLSGIVGAVLRARRGARRD